MLIEKKFWENFVFTWSCQSPPYVELNRILVGRVGEDHVGVMLRERNLGWMFLKSRRRKHMIFFFCFDIAYIGYGHFFKLLFQKEGTNHGPSPDSNPNIANPATNPYQHHNGAQRATQGRGHHRQQIVTRWLTSDGALRANSNIRIYGISSVNRWKDRGKILRRSGNRFCVPRRRRSGKIWSQPHRRHCAW